MRHLGIQFNWKHVKIFHSLHDHHRYDHSAICRQIAQLLHLCNDVAFFNIVAMQCTTIKYFVNYWKFMLLYIFCHQEKKSNVKFIQFIRSWTHCSHPCCLVPRACRNIFRYKKFKVQFITTQYLTHKVSPPITVKSKFHIIPSPHRCTRWKPTIQCTWVNVHMHTEKIFKLVNQILN